MPEFTKRFGSTVYSFDAYFGTSKSKEKAEARAKDRRRRGYRARVVKVKAGYQVFFA